MLTMETAINTLLHSEVTIYFSGRWEAAESQAAFAGNLTPKG